MDNVTVIRVFIASPGDVKKQREIVRKLIEEWNNNNSWRGVLVEPIMWETHSQAESGAHPQKIIDRQLLKEFKCDVLVGIFHQRLGSPTDTHGSGTVEEIDYFIKRKAGNDERVMLFFCQWGIDWDADVKQVKEVKQFHKDVQNKSLCPTIKSRAQFAKTMRNHLFKLLEKLVADMGITKLAKTAKRKSGRKPKKAVRKAAAGITSPVGTPPRGASKTAPKRKKAKGRVKPRKVAAAQLFVGIWRTIAVPGSGQFDIALNSDLMALRAHGTSPTVIGTWRLKRNGEAWVSWDDGWKDKLLLQPDGTALKIAYEKGTDWTGRPHNRQPAIKVG